MTFLIPLNQLQLARRLEFVGYQNIFPSAKLRKVLHCIANFMSSYVDTGYVWVFCILSSFDILLGVGR